MFLDEKPAYLLDTDKGGGSGTSETELEEESGEQEEESEELETEEEEEAEASPKEGKGPDFNVFLKHPRGKRIYSGYKDAQEYRKMGSLEQIAADKKRLDYYDDQIAQAEESKSATPEAEDAKEKKAKLVKALRDLEPNLERLGEVIDNQEVYRESLRYRAAEATEGVMEELDLEVNDESYVAFSRVLQELITSDKRLFTIYTTAPERAVQAAAKLYAEPIRKTGSRKDKADLIKRRSEASKGTPAPAPRSSGGPTVKKQEEPQDIKEAEKLFVAGMEQADRG